MSRRHVSLSDKYALESGEAFLSGVQTLVRLPLDQSRLDRAAGLRTAGFISGYRGSPLGGYDQQLERAKSFLDAHDIRFWEGVNEDLAATAVWGSQQLGIYPGARFDGVFGLWYGKAPGVDRTGDVFKHANFAGVAAHGGVLAVAGDDHVCKSSTLPSQSEFPFVDAEIPILNPSSVQDVLDFGLFGWALSRYSGLWTALVATSDTMDSGAVIDLDLARHRFVEPADFERGPDGVSLRGHDKPLDMEARLRRVKLPAAQAFARANGVNRVVFAGARKRLAIASTGTAVRDVLEALDSLGLTPASAAAAGVALYKIAMPWPLEPHGARAFAEGAETLLVVEHKRALIEPQMRDVLFDLPQRPRVIGKRDEAGHPLLSDIGALSVAEIAAAIYERLPAEARTERAEAYFARIGASRDAAGVLQADIKRTPHFCSGCPHNTSTLLPDGSRALAGIGCHYLATYIDRADMNSHMGGEGASWIGQAPFTDEKHIFVNMGDGTYSHSGLLAIRGAVSAKIDITYKILFNGAVAMTGGQVMESGQTVREIVDQVRAEGVAKVVVVAEDPARHVQAGDLGPMVEIYDRSRLDEVQRDLREIKGVSVLIYDQACATEKRRKIKRGLMPASQTRVLINAAVCEGCGDCSVKSNCLSVEPLETDLGVKRRINQSTCNQDLSCVQGFCPSFVTVEGAVNAQRLKPRPEFNADGLPEPTLPVLDGAYNIVLTGVGGTGVTTISAIIGAAAFIDGNAATTLDQAGLAQKGGPVTSHVRVARKASDLSGPARTPAAMTDALIAADAIVSTSADTLMLLEKSRTRVALNRDVAPTADFIADRTIRFESRRLERKLVAATQSLDGLNAEALAEEYLFDQMFANMILLGFAWARGLVPVSREAILEAIALNGAAVADNARAFDLGWVAATSPERLVAPSSPPPALTLDGLIEDRAARLTAYQDAAYAARYRDLVAFVRAHETAKGLGERFTRAVAENAAKLMAYKDEYEVARLYTDGAWAKEMKETFGGDYKISFHLAPPLLARRDSVTGELKKQRFGGWLLPVFGVLARLKGVRGTRWDLFGLTRERREERALRDAYEGDMRALAETLSPARYELSVSLADLPDRIRGFGHVKERAISAARENAAALKVALATADRTARAAAE